MAIWGIANFRSTWASSVWSFRFLWWQIVYRSDYAVSLWWYWCSTGWHGTEDIITW
jgi:hypothetical protein